MMHKHVSIHDSQALTTATTRSVLLLVAGVALGLGLADASWAQALEPVVRASTIVRDTVVGVCLMLLTAAWGIAGYRMAFQGANFRDVSANIIGGAVSGGAAAIAAVFIA